VNQERSNVVALRMILAAGFDTFLEVPVRHALFTRRTLRIDLLAIPKHAPMNDIALGFEIKGCEEWDIPSMARCLKQAGDYVLATVEPAAALHEHVGKRIMAVFIYPGPEVASNVRPSDDPQVAFLGGMIHMAGHHRVGSVRVATQYREQPNALFCPNQVWSQSRGWRSDARNILVGRRQIGSQRFPILDELTAVDQPTAGNLVR